MGKRSFICRSSLEGSIVFLYPYYFFQFLAFCGIVLIFSFMGVLSLSQNIFVKMVHVSVIASHLKFTFPCHFYINVTLSRCIFLFMLFFHFFCLGISEEDALLVKYISCKICIFLRSTGKHDMYSGQKSDIV